MPFEKGHTKAGGRKEGTPNVTTTKLFEDLLKEMKKVEKDKQISVLKHFIERAYENDTVLCSLMKKLVADQLATKIEGDEKEIIVIGAEEGTREKLIEKVDAIANRREQEMADWSEKQWIDYIKEIQSRKERKEVNDG